MLANKLLMRLLDPPAAAPALGGVVDAATGVARAGDGGGDTWFAGGVRARSGADSWAFRIGLWLDAAVVPPPVASGERSVVAAAWVLMLRQLVT